MHVVTDKYGRTFVFRDYVMIARAIDVQKKKRTEKEKKLGYDKSVWRASQYVSCIQK